MTRHPTSTHRGLRLLALCAVTLGLLLLAAAAFVLSYAGVHAVALAAGVSPRLARIYPLILDAMVVVAGAAVLSLRSAGLPSRWYAWLSLLVMLGADAGADTVHAIGTKLPHKPTAAAAAIIPWALVLIGFGLLLSMLRHGRIRAADMRLAAKPAGSAEPGEPQTAVEAEPEAPDEPAAQAEAGVDAPAGLEAPVEPEIDVEPQAWVEQEAEVGFEPQDGVEPEDEFEPQDNGENEAHSPDGIETEAEHVPGATGGPGTAPQFQRVRSTPVPPEG